MRYDFNPLHPARSVHDVEIVGIIVAILFMFLWYGVITLPCTFIVYFLWKPTRRIRPSLSKYLVQAALIAFAYAPVIYGHAGPLPAVITLMANDPMFRGEAIASLVLVFVISFAVLIILALRKDQTPADRVPGT
jgi:hypothetical protein